MSDDRYVLITGASGGLGRALVRRLEQEGCWLALAGRDEARLREAHPASDHPLVVGDASTADGAASLLQQCQQHYGQPPDALAHCVGSRHWRSLATGRPDGLAVVAGHRPDHRQDLIDGRRLQRHPAAGSLTHRY